MKALKNENVKKNGLPPATKAYNFSYAKPDGWFEY